MVEYDYPDVLGTITGGPRVEMETLQAALGVFPGRAALGQPFELLLLLQSVIDQPQEVVLAARLPRQDAAGQRLSFFLPKKQFKLRLGPGEVGLMHLPVVAQPPTPPARGYPAQVKLLAQPTGEGHRQVRARGRGRPPSVLSLSPFRLEVLRDVGFGGDSRPPDTLRCRFDVIPGQVNVGLVHPTPKYETLWTAQDYQAERGKIEEVISLAEEVMLDFTRSNIFFHVQEATRERFGRAGLPLHPGEALFVAKSLTYVFEDALQVEQGFTLHEGRWFQWLCSLLVRDPAVAGQDRGELAAGPLYLGAVYDAVRVGLPMVEVATRQRFGTAQEHRLYAEKVVQALQGGIPIDLSHAYLPLIMAGLLLNVRIKLSNENPWESVDALEEAMRGRARLAADAENPIFRSVETLTEKAREALRYGRIPRE